MSALRSALAEAQHLQKGAGKHCSALLSQKRRSFAWLVVKWVLHFFSGCRQQTLPLFIGIMQCLRRFSGGYWAKSSKCYMLCCGINHEPSSDCHPGTMPLQSQGRLIDCCFVRQNLEPVGQCCQIMGNFPLRGKNQGARERGRLFLTK